VHDHSGSTYASISFHAILNQVVERVGVDYYDGEPFFTNNWKSQAVGDSHKGPLITGGNPFSRNIKNAKRTHQRQTTTTARLTPTAQQAAGPSTPSGENPPLSRAGRPLGRNNASLEGWTPPRAKLCLARGLDATSGGTPPRSRAGCPLGPNSALLEV
jgi:hypothetical protein